MGLSMFDINDISGKDLSYLDDLDLHLIQTEEDCKLAFERLSKAEFIALDTETEGLSPMHHKIVGVILAPSGTESYYFPLKHKIGKNLDEAIFIYYFRELAKIARFILFNAKFDWKMIWYHWKIDFTIFADAQIEAYLLNSDLAESDQNKLKLWTKKIFNIEPLELSDYGETNFSLFDPEEAYKYAAPDGTNTYNLWQYFKPLIEKFGLQKAEKIETDVVKAVGQIELNGIRIDTDILKSQQQQMKARIDELIKKIYTYAGHEFDVNSPQQMAVVIYDELGITPVMNNGEPDRSVGADNLKHLMKEHPIIKAISNYREVFKLYNDFVIKLPECISEDSRLHSNLNPMGTRSGRFSSSGGFGRGGQKIKINTQQMPKAKGFEVEDVIKLPDSSEIDFNQEYEEDELNEIVPNWEELQNNIQNDWKDLRVVRYIPVKIRDSFVPSDGYIWVSADYSQLEYRTVANLAKDEGLIKSFMDGVDFHTATASMMFNVPIDKVDKKLRKRGKTLNFGNLYGMSVWGLADRLGCSKEEAQDLQDLYFERIPKVKLYTDQVKKEVKARKYSRTYFGRIRHFKKQLENTNGSFSKEDQILKQAFNTTIQGSAADLAKIALYRAYEAAKPYNGKIRLLSQVHDEINFEVQCVSADGTIDVQFLEEAIKVIDYAMSFRGVVPGWADVPADIEVGRCYGQLKDPKDFGVNMQELLKDVAPTNVDLEFFKPLDAGTSIIDSSNLSQKTNVNTNKNETKPKENKFTTRDSIVKEVVKPQQRVTTQVSQEIQKSMSAGQQQKEKLQQEQEKRKMERIDLSNAKFPQSTVVIHRKESVDDDTAFNLLKKFIAANFGTNDLVLEDAGMLYKFPEQYRVSDSFNQLETAYDIQYFKVAPKIKLSL